MSNSRARQKLRLARQHARFATIPPAYRERAKSLARIFTIYGGKKIFNGGVWREQTFAEFTENR